MKVIGIDLDNTIVQYDHIIYEIAVRRDLIPAATERNKTIIRNTLRASGLESLWTEIQGYIYGDGMHNARPFPGVIPFLRSLSNNGFSLCIISHRTQYPYSGENTDLHQAAMKWLIKEGIVGDSCAPVLLEKVFFELTKDAKYQRIRDQNCFVFIDDLIEFLMSNLFPKEVIPMLFDPYDNHPENMIQTRITSWDQAADIIRSL